MKRTIRVSEFKDYLAVDITNEDGKILSTPLYLAKDKPVQVKSFDQEDERWNKTELTFNGEGVLARDIDIKSSVHGMEWEVAHSDLLDKDQFEF